MITLKMNPGEKYIELGGGANPQIHPNVDVRQCYDTNGNPTVDFTANFEEPLPIGSEEFDGVFSHFVIEHLSWRKVPLFISEMYRILKPGGKAVVVTANVEAQLEWIKNNPNGWDGKPAFESMSCLLFGDQDYPENTHKNWMSFVVARRLFMEAGFYVVELQPYGERSTDMVIQATRRDEKNKVINMGVSETPTAQVPPARVFAKAEELKKKVAESFAPVQREDKPVPGGGSRFTHNAAPSVHEKYSREQMFDKHYWNGGGKVGGYAREGYWDYPVHELTVQHIMSRNPSSVYELGASRGYILKRLQDRGVKAYGVEISKHCIMTRVADSVALLDVCVKNLPTNDASFDLAFSIAVLEHIPEQFLPHVLGELKRISNRGLHGVDFGHNDDGFDKTHCTLKPQQWWRKLFDEHGLQSHEIVDKEDLEKGEYPPVLFSGDGKIKLNIGSFTTMFHHGWLNIDALDVTHFANAYRYNFLQRDIRQGFLHGTETVDLIYTGHFLEHLTYDEGLKFLRECRRVLKPSGAMRIIVPDLGLLAAMYIEGQDLSNFDEINDGCAQAKTQAAKYWSLIHPGHSAGYDHETLGKVLTDAGFEPVGAMFRTTHAEPVKQILRETLDVLPCLSLYTDALPK